LKKSTRRNLKFLFWAVAVLSALWVAFAPPPKKPHREPQKVTVTQSNEFANVPTGEDVQPAPSSPVPVEPPPPSSPLAETPAIPYLGKPRIAIVIDDVGLDMGRSRRAVALPPAVTLSYIPYSTRLNVQTKEAREVGHELLLHMPMEPMGSADPGPGALRVALPQEELRRRLDNALASFVGFDGMNNHMGSKFTADSAGMAMVIGELKQRHLFFLDSRTSAQTVGAAIARKMGVPTISRDVFLDDDMSASSVHTQLEQVEKVAKHKGYAVAIGHPHPATLKALEEWLPEAERRGFVFVPLKSLVNPTAQ
jgi:polysaccharide deacetylase 2 family uncharacterized protein YibQ